MEGKTGDALGRVPAQRRDRHDHAASDLAVASSQALFGVPEMTVGLLAVVALLSAYLPKEV